MPEPTHPRRRLTPDDCVGGGCPWIDRDGDDWLVNGYDEATGEERIVRLPAARGHEAATADA